MGGQLNAVAPRSVETTLWSEDKAIHSALQHHDENPSVICIVKPYGVSITFSQTGSAVTYHSRLSVNQTLVTLMANAKTL